MFSSFNRGVWRRAFGAGVAFAAAWFLLGAAPAHAQQGAVAGSVTDGGTGEPVAGAQVFVEGTSIGQLTNAEGRYRITGVPTGEQTVRVRLIGYRAASQTVTVSSGQSATADFELEQTALKLQELRVTGMATAMPKVKMPFTVDQVDTEMAPVPSANVSSFIQGKVAGVSIVQSTGKPGTEADILLRGSTSIDASGRGQAPLIVIDGVIQAQGASLADINSLDIENVEVVKGAAAASLYGSRAANGVVQITTKDGSEMRGGDRFQLTVRGEGGISELSSEFPLSRFHRFAMDEGQTTFVDADGNPIEYGDDIVPETSNAAKLFQDNPYPGETFNHMERFFDPGDTYSAYAALSGRLDETNFRVSGEQFNETGIVLGNDGYERQNLRMNLDHEVGESFRFSTSGFYSRSTQDELPTGIGGVFFGLNFMAPSVDLAKKTKGGKRNAAECTGGLDDDCWFVADPDPRANEVNPLFQIQQNIDTDRRTRVMGSGDVSWSPLTWLTVEGNFSYDRTNADFRRLDPKDAPLDEEEQTGRDQGSLLKRSDFTEAVNASVTLNLNKVFGDDLTTRTKLRYLVEDQHDEFQQAFAPQFAVKGVPQLDALTGDPSLNSGEQDIVSQGYFFITGLDYQGKYIADLMVRRDGSSLFGPEERWHTYFRGSGAYRVSQEEWWPLESIFDEFKVRYSYGTAGGRPNFSAQYETFNLGSGGTISYGTLGNRNLKPEYSVEQEMGVDMVLFERLGLDVTYATSDTEDQLLRVPLSAPFGFARQWQNAGTLSSETFEVSLNAAVVEKEDLAWNVRANWDRTRGEITEFGLPPFRYGPTIQNGDRYFARLGEEIGTIYGTDFIRNCQDVHTTLGSNVDCSLFSMNDDGYFVPVGQGNGFRSGVGPDGIAGTADDLWGTSLTVGGQSLEWGMPVPVQRVDELCLENDPSKSEAECTTGFVPIGRTTPDFSANFSSNFRWKGLSLYTLLDASVGMDVYNQTRQWGYREGRHAEIDQAGRPEELKKPLKYYSVYLYQINATSAHFLEDGTFLKLREVSLGYTLDEDLRRNLFGNAFERVTLNLIGRNLITWTDYTGYDPEVGFGSGTGSGGEAGSAAVTRYDGFNYPNFRTFTAALELVF